MAQLIDYVGYPRFQLNKKDGTPMEGGKVFTYIAGSTTPTPCYPTIADAQAGTNALPNPIILDSWGSAIIVKDRALYIVVEDTNGDVVFSLNEETPESDSLSDLGGNLAIKASGYNYKIANGKYIEVRASMSSPVLIPTGGTNTDLTILGAGSGTVRIGSETGGTFGLPSGPGAAGQVVISDGIGGSSWSNPSFTGTSVPAGCVVAFAKSTGTPAGFLECNGQTVNRGTYSDLFAVIGTQYGAGDGVNTFGLPDLRDRTIMGSGGAGSSGIIAATVGAIGGVFSHALSQAELPAHTHSLPLGAGIPSGGTVLQSGNTGIAFAAGANFIYPTATGSIGSTTAHTNTQPTMVMRYCIRT